MEINNKNAQIWESLYANDKNKARIPYTEVMIFLAKYFKGEGENKRLLEIGCGMGNNLYFASLEFNFDVYGIDVSKTAINIAKDKFETTNVPYKSFEVMDAQNLQFEDEYFDAIIDRAASLQCSTFNDGKKVMQEVSRVLKNNGCFYTTVATQNHHLFFNGDYLGDGSYENKEHDGVRQFYANHQIVELFSNDFEILEWNIIDTLNMLTQKTTTSIHHVGCKKVG